VLPPLFTNFFVAPATAPAAPAPISPAADPDLDLEEVYHPDWLLPPVSICLVYNLCLYSMMLFQSLLLLLSQLLPLPLFLTLKRCFMKIGFFQLILL
jgi:hypothetical protein